jgi:hypothetical protein
MFSDRPIEAFGEFDRQKLSAIFVFVIKRAPNDGVPPTSSGIITFVAEDK